MYLGNFRTSARCPGQPGLVSLFPSLTPSSQPPLALLSSLSQVNPLVNQTRPRTFGILTPCPAFLAANERENCIIPAKLNIRRPRTAGPELSLVVAGPDSRTSSSGTPWDPLKRRIDKPPSLRCSTCALRRVDLGTVSPVIDCSNAWVVLVLRLVPHFGAPGTLK